MPTEQISEINEPKESTASADGVAWSLASLWLGAVALITAPPMMVFLQLEWGVGPERATHINSLDDMAFSIQAMICTMMMLSLAVCGIQFGLKGRRIDQENCERSPLAMAGILVGLAAGMGWIIVSITIPFLENAR